ncbi:MAG: alpha/beta fold hydrolase, partial [Pseudomonadota bacterium]|nr:alpha/beta fold hydrolase [Pseudomonadota bacterium]
EDLRAELAAIRCPALLLMGQRDRLVPAGCGPAMAALLPATRLHLFEGAGHAPFFSHPEAFVRHLREFLNA